MQQTGQQISEFLLLRKLCAEHFQDAIRIDGVKVIVNIGLVGIGVFQVDVSQDGADGSPDSGVSAEGVEIGGEDIIVIGQ